MCDVEVEATGTWWIGPATAQRSAPGSLPVKSWILPSCPTSTGLTQTNRGVRLEASVEGGAPVAVAARLSVSVLFLLSLTFWFLLCLLSLSVCVLSPSLLRSPAGYPHLHLVYLHPRPPHLPAISLITASISTPAFHSTLARSSQLLTWFTHLCLPARPAGLARLPPPLAASTTPPRLLAPRLDPRLHVLTYPSASLPPSLQPCALRSSSFSVPRVLVCLSPSFHLPSPRACFFLNKPLFHPQRCVWVRSVSHRYKKYLLQLMDSSFFRISHFSI
ncbi:uncharacterized protein LOC119902940 [Micropterus salmoides]|uniref:uncharacterized protein LOC119902940 n=1 Tax=Micropterus salmoides TaxID=27706 RepID=UPI0018ECD5D6|nr:uncharacterized protein LOC119902940 [Micropterus salmoides]